MGPGRALRQREAIYEPGLRLGPVGRFMGPGLDVVPGAIQHEHEVRQKDFLADFEEEEEDFQSFTLRVGA